MIFSDSVHGTIFIPDTYKDLLESPPLMRLRNIRQLGFTPSIYSGAVHTRFEHTIGKTGVLLNLLDQFNVHNSVLRERYILASLLSEIGTYPLSYSTSWLFSKKIEKTKKDYAYLLCDIYFSHVYAISESEKKFIWEDGHPDHEWINDISVFKHFANLNILKLAGDIDYTLRDGHYSGRYQNNFDYRYFRTLVEFSSDNCLRELEESIRELYRSIYYLNSVYGDKTRRFITLIFVRLVELLVEKGYMDIEEYKQAHNYGSLS